MEQLLTEIRDLLIEIRDELSGKKPAVVQAEEVDDTRPVNEVIPQLARIWNDHCGVLPKVLAFSPATRRYRMAKQRWHEKPDAEYWVEIVKILGESKFCSGFNDQKWVATFDFLIRPDTRFKAMEGVYGKRSPLKQQYVAGHLTDGTPIIGSK